jgi:hypothetical protein
VKERGDEGGQEEEDEEDMNPLPTPPISIKIGPPKGKKRTYEGQSQPADTPVPGDPTRREGEAEGTEVKVKVEEDDDLPYRLGILARPGKTIPLPDVDSVASTPTLLEYVGKVSVEGEKEATMVEEPQAIQVFVTKEVEERVERPKEAMLMELVATLKDLKLELAGRPGIKRLVEGVESEVGQALRNEHNAEGDVCMKEREGLTDDPQNPPTYYQGLDLDVPTLPLMLMRIRELERRMDAEEKAFGEYQWKVSGAEIRMEDRVGALEGKTKELAKKTRREKGGHDQEGWTTVKRQQGPGRAVTRAMWTSLEGRVDARGKDMGEIRGRLGEVEREAKRLDTWKRRVEDLERHVTEVQIAANEAEIKVTRLDGRIEELRSRADQAKIQDVTELAANVTANLFQVYFRIDTLERHVVGVDRVMGAMWLAVNPTSEKESLDRVNNLATIWNSTTDAFRSRNNELVAIVTGTVRPPSFANSTLRASAPSFIPSKQNVVPAPLSVPTFGPKNDTKEKTYSSATATRI